MTVNSATAGLTPMRSAWMRLRGRFSRVPVESPEWFPRAQAAEVEIPLSASFKFAHEPVEAAFRPAHFVGREADLDALAQRILFSEGGSFLVTGYRGVGKTSFVNQVIHRIRDVLPRLEPQIGKLDVVDVHLTLARSVTGAELMHHIIRRLHDRLVETGRWKHLPSHTRSQLELAYRRTSMNVTHKSTETNERQSGVSEAGMTNALLGAFKLVMTRKLTSSRADEATFLGYDDKAAENDVLRIARQLTAPRKRRWWHWRVRPRLKIVFVFDELDKMDDPAVAATPQERPLDQILGSLKNLFTTSGICFLFVAGKDLHERWLEDLGRGDSIYESVFCFDKYLPCLWEETEAICRCFVDEKELSRRGSDAIAARGNFERYLHYKGRGIPRRIIREFNQFVVWRGTQPVLAFSKQDIRRFRFYAELQALLETRWKNGRPVSFEDAVTTQADKERLGILYLVDWILARGKNDFTADDAVNASHALSAKIAPAKEIAPAVIGELLAFLVRHDYLVEVRSDPASVIQPVQRPVRYRLATRRIAELGQVPADVPEIRDIVPAKFGPAIDPSRFINVEKVASGGMGEVYRAWDARHGRFVAIKTPAVSTPEAIQRFEREAELMKLLRHPNIVQFYEFVRSDSEPAQSAIIMEYIDGTSLHTILARTQRLPPPIAIAILRQIVYAVAHVHGHRIVRLDLKPSNVLVSREGRLLISDFGIAKRLAIEEDHPTNVLTAPNVFIGTPLYMAPEQFEELSPDERADIYSLGTMLFEMIVGLPPFAKKVGGINALLARKRLETAPRCSEFVEVHSDIDELIARCLERDPDQRYQTAMELLQDVEGAERVADRELAEILEARVGRSEQERSKRERTTANRAADREATGTVAVALSAAAIITPQIAVPRNDVSGARLRMVAPPQLAGMIFEVNRNVRIGRSDEAELRIDSPLISRMHALITRGLDTCYIEDLNSANGTRVGGENIKGRVTLNHGASIVIGDVQMIFEWFEAAIASFNEEFGLSDSSM